MASLGGSAGEGGGGRWCWARSGGCPPPRRAAAAVNVAATPSRALAGGDRRPELTSTGYGTHDGQGNVDSGAREQEGTGYDAEGQVKTAFGKWPVGERAGRVGRRGERAQSTRPLPPLPQAMTRSQAQRPFPPPRATLSRPTRHQRRPGGSPMCLPRRPGTPPPRARAGGTRQSCVSSSRAFSSTGGRRSSSSSPRRPERDRYMLHPARSLYTPSNARMPHLASRSCARSRSCRSCSPAAAASSSRNAAQLCPQLCQQPWHHRAPPFR